LGAKQYAGIIRLVSKSDQERTAMLYQLGFTDPSHLNKEFQKIAGTNPEHFFNELEKIDRTYVHLF
jgi:hypothetical protein